MKTILLYTIYFLMLATSIYSNELNLTKQEKDWIKNNPIIKVSNQADWPPYDFLLNGLPSGYSVDIVKELSKKLGLNVKFVSADNWAELLNKFDDTEIDLMHTMAWSQEREDKYDYSDPYMPYKSSYIIRSDEENINSTDDLDGKILGTGKGWNIVHILREKYPNSTILEFKNSLEIIEALSTKKIDVAIDDIITVKYLMTENFITNIKHGGYIQGDNSQTFFYFVANKQNQELVNIFNKAYNVLTIQDKLRLQKKWFANLENNNITFNKEEYAYLQNKKKIKICIDPNWMPFESFDTKGRHIGMTAEYFKIFKNELNIPFEVLKTKTWAESIHAAKTRQCDLYSLAMQTPERKEYMDFTSPYLSIPLVLATKLDVPFIDKIKSIKNRKIGIVKGYAFNEIIRNIYPNIEVVDVKNINVGLQKVANGELFGFVGTLASVGYAFQKKFVGELKISGKFDEKWTLGIGTRNDEPMLNTIFEKLIKSISAEKHQSILNRYIAINYEKNTDYDLIIKILIVVFILGAIGIYFYRRLSLINKKMKKLQHKLIEQANRDPMTNLYNRRHLYDVASDLVKISKREKNDIGIIMLDIDNFKQINDIYGHAIGDKVIKTLAKVLIAHTRESDIISRFGGEEFVLLLPNTNKKGSYKIASNIRGLVQNEIINIDKETNINFTISLGVDNVMYEDKSIDESLNRADKALYKAKENGKNQVSIFNDGSSI